MSDDNIMRETVRRARELLAFVSTEPDNWNDHNALIAAGLCNDELPALCDEIEQLRADLARVTAERDRLLKREEHFASVLRVTDRGQYRADWDSAIRRVVAERDALRAKMDSARAEGRAAGLREALAIAREVESVHSDSLLCSDLTYGKAYGAGVVAGCIEELIAKGGGA
jgi:hypothetical protein